MRDQPRQPRKCCPSLISLPRPHRADHHEPTSCFAPVTSPTQIPPSLRNIAVDFTSPGIAELKEKRWGRSGVARDVTQILYNWFSDEGASGCEELPFPQRDFSISRSLRTTELLLRTAAWQARFGQWTDDMEEDLAASQLFVKPDDQAEVNDVSSRCANVTEAAWLFLQQCVSKATEYDRLQVPDVLREPRH